MKKVLVIKSSAKGNESYSNQLVNELVLKFKKYEIIFRDVNNDLPNVNQKIITGFYSKPETWSEEVKEAMITPNYVLSEFMNSDIIIIGSPIYNFSIPSTLKMWIDLIVRAGVTFKFSEDHIPIGLVPEKKVYLTFASNGTEIGSKNDFASTYLKSIFGFIGIKDIKLYCVFNTNVEALALESLNKAKAEIAKLII